MSKLLDYCTADTFVRPVTFNYYVLFSDYISSDISGDSRVKFNLNPDDGMLKFPGAIETNINRGENMIHPNKEIIVINK